MTTMMTINDFIEIVSTPNEYGLTPTFGVTFTKKTTGEVRTMSARRGVKKGVKNAEGANGSHNRKVQDAANAVLTVYDMNKVDDNKPLEENKGAFRRINMEGLISVKVKGVQYKYDAEKKLLVAEE